MRLKNKLAFFFTLLLSLSLLAGAEVERYNVLISTSGASATIPDRVGGLTVSFEEIIAGSPSTVSIVIAGCKSGDTCTTLETNTTTTASQNRTPTVSTIYDYFKVTASWTGGTNVSVRVNATLDTVSNGGGASGVSITTVAGLASVAGKTAGTIAVVTDGNSATDCTTGSASTLVTCQYSGSVWAALATGGSSGLSGMTATQVPIAASASTVTSSKVLYGSGTGLASSADPGATAEVPMVADGTHGQKPSASGALNTGAFAAVPTLSSLGAAASNAATTVNGQTCTLGSTCTVAASTWATTPVAASTAIPYVGMMFWFSSDCMVLSDGGTCGNGGFSNGSTGSFWADRSGHGFNGVCTSGNYTYNTSQINSLPAVNMNSTCKMNLPPSNASPPTEVYWAGAGTAFVVAKNTAGGSGGGTFIGGATSTFGYGTGGGSKEQSLDRDNSANVARGSAASDTSWHQMNVTCGNGGITNSTNVAFRLGEATDAAGTSANCGTGPMQGYIYGIGWDPAGGSACACQFGEIIYYNRILSSTEIGQVETYLNGKYGI